jgi:hypothetical protein
VTTPPGITTEIDVMRRTRRIQHPATTPPYLLPPTPGTTLRIHAPVASDLMSER